MPSASRHRNSTSPLRRGCLAVAALAVGSLAGAPTAHTAAAQAAAAHAAIDASAARSPAARSSAAGGSALFLAGQTSWVKGASGLRLQLRIESSLPVSRLGLRFVLYSRLTSRSAFTQSTTGIEPPSEIAVDSPPTIPLASLDQRGYASGSVTVHFPVTTGPSAPTSSLTSPRLDLSCGNQCDGVYPLEAVLVDSSDGAPLATLTTDLIETAGTRGTLPLGVSLVLPMGYAPALDSRGQPVLDASRLAGIEALLTTVKQFPRVPVTLELYPQLLVALERDHAKLAQTVLGLLDAVLSRRDAAPATQARQVLGATFAPVEATALASGGLNTELALQLARGREALVSGLGRNVEASPFVSYGPLSSKALTLLAADGVRQLVVPAKDVTTTTGSTPPAVSLTLTSPFDLLAATATSSSSPTSGRSGSKGSRATSGLATPVAFAADAELAAHFAASADPVLAAHQLIADLAEIYFDFPSDLATRGVVVAPTSYTPNARFLSTIFTALAHAPLLTARTLSGAFAQVPVGGNGSPTREQLVSGAGQSVRATDVASVVAARQALRVVASILPSDKALLARLGDAVLLGESAMLDRASRARYEDAPQTALRQLGGLLRISGGRTVTLTSHTGEIPVTIVSSSPFPIHASIVLRDSALDFVSAGAATAVTFDRSTTALQFKVKARASGNSRLDIAVVSSAGRVTLLSSSFIIQSTAVSGVAVALSIGALLVLGAWWIRSLLRHRRQRMARPGAPDEPLVVV